MYEKKFREFKKTDHKTEQAQGSVLGTQIELKTMEQQIPIQKELAHRNSLGNNVI